jgi:hypothetical protein
MPAWAGPREAWQNLYNVLQTFRGQWPARGWSWDSRLFCASSSFSTENEQRARAAVLGSFTVQWSSSSIGKAPTQLRELAERSGGIRSGQLLVATAAQGMPIAFGLWWPWGDGEMISMRVGLVDIDPGAEPYSKLRDIFGVTL